MSVCVAEWARSLRGSAFPATGRRTRSVYRLQYDLKAVADLTDETTLVQLGLASEAPQCFLDKAFCRRIARELRAGSPELDAIQVPSVAFLGDAARWNLVVYLDRVAPGALSSPYRISDLRVDKTWDPMAAARLLASGLRSRVLRSIREVVRTLRR